MFYDPHEAVHKKKVIENYENLKESLKGKDEFCLAFHHLIEMEQKIQKLETDLDKYLGWGHRVDESLLNEFPTMSFIAYIF